LPIQSSDNYDGDFKLSWA